MIPFAVFFSVVVALAAGCGDFYWRDYDGSIPADAIPAGTGADKEVYYIGHAYLHGYGVLMGTIRKGRREITIPCYGVKRTNKRVQILCAQDHSKYYWSPTKADKLKELVSDMCPVLGGWDAKAAAERGYSLGTLYIGRKRYHDELLIGNIAAYSLERNEGSKLFFPYDGDEHSSTDYEILMYTPSPSANYNGVDNIFNLDVIPVDS